MNIRAATRIRISIILIGAIIIGLSVLGYYQSMQLTTQLENLNQQAVEIAKEENFANAELKAQIAQTKSRAENLNNQFITFVLWGRFWRSCCLSISIAPSLSV